MVPIRYWRMVLGNITPKASDRDVEVEKITPRLKRGEDGKPTQETEGYNLSFLALKGCTQTVKLPLTAEASVKKIQELLADGQAIVRVKFIGLSMRAYQMNVDHENLVGITASADDVEVTSIDRPDIDDVTLDFD